jgi:hypothetical protein
LILTDDFDLRIFPHRKYCITQSNVIITNSKGRMLIGGGKASNCAHVLCAGQTLTDDNRFSKNNSMIKRVDDQTIVAIRHVSRILFLATQPRLALVRSFKPNLLRYVEGEVAKTENQITLGIRGSRFFHNFTFFQVDLNLRYNY